MKSNRNGALIFLLASLILTVLVGVGLPHLELLPGMPVPVFENGQVALPRADAPPVGMPVSSFAGVFVLILLAVFVIFLIFQMARGIAWKRILPRLLALAWKILLVIVLVGLVLALLPKSQGSISEQPIPAPKPLATGPLGPVPTTLIWLVAIGLLVVACVLGAVMIFAKRQPAPRPFELEVEIARQALLDGQDLRTVILQCYRRMGQALAQERHIERESFMTTGEFEKLLTARGVPYGPVHQLTRLFEHVRYGHWEPAPGDEQGAVHCLNAILLYSRHAGGEVSE